MKLEEILVTDRSQADVDSGTEKGFYNASDMNRVTEVMKYLDGVFSGYGYITGYTPIVIGRESLRNIVKNGDFSNGSTDWSVSEGISIENGAAHFSQTTGLSILMQSMENPIAGHKYYGRILIKTDAPISTQDNRYEWYHSDQPGETLIFARKTGNFPDWSILSSVITCQSSIDGWALRNFFATLSDTDVYLTEHMIVDLTSGFGAEKEPEKEWCDKNIPFFNESMTLQRTSWIEGEIPTFLQLEQYLSNVSALRNTINLIGSTPQTPESMDLVGYVEANNIEKILVDIETIINRMISTFVPCGEAISGGDYL